MTNKKKKKKKVVVNPEEFADLCERIVLGGDVLLERLWEEDDGSHPTINQLEFENAIYFDTERLLKVVSNKFGYPVPTMTLDEQFGHFTLDEPVVNEPMPELVIRQVVKATP